MCRRVKFQSRNFPSLCSRVMMNAMEMGDEPMDVELPQVVPTFNGVGNFPQDITPPQDNTQQIGEYRNGDDRPQLVPTRASDLATENHASIFTSDDGEVNSQNSMTTATVSELNEPYSTEDRQSTSAELSSTSTTVTPVVNPGERVDDGLLTGQYINCVGGTIFRAGNDSLRINNAGGGFNGGWFPSEYQMRPSMVPTMCQSNGQTNLPPFAVTALPDPPFISGNYPTNLIPAGYIALSVSQVSHDSSLNYAPVIMPTNIIPPPPVNGPCFGPCCLPQAPSYPIIYSPPNEEFMYGQQIGIPFSRVVPINANAQEFHVPPPYFNGVTQHSSFGPEMMWSLPNCVNTNVTPGGSAMMMMPSQNCSSSCYSEASVTSCTSDNDSVGFSSGSYEAPAGFLTQTFPTSQPSSVPSSPTSSIPSSYLSSTSTPFRRRMVRRPKYQNHRNRNYEAILMPRSNIRNIVDCKTTFFMNGIELPYVLNVWDPNSINWHINPSKNTTYYVPPIVPDFDFFGGQQQMWQIKMSQFFGRFRPDLWKIQAVPDFYRNPAEGWIAFPITAKLRFCCRACRTPWTSKQGQIFFAFIMDLVTRRGYVFMKLFGQVCMKADCSDTSYQTAACYPEEIERAVARLSEYVAFIYYGASLSTAAMFEECRKSIRVAGTGKGKGAENQHRKELCQACTFGICRGAHVKSKPTSTPTFR